MRRTVVASLAPAAVVLGLALGAVGGYAQSGGASMTGWDGVNPFRCTLQNAGTGTAVPDPGADPYCVYFDKTHQNVSELGVVQFLSLEPARVAAAAPKCFYFQSDHWKGSVVQDDGTTQIWEFYGHYFYDKARAAGGAWVTGFTINGKTADPNQIPGIPQQWSQYLGPGTGGMQAFGGFPGDPTCAAKAAANPAAIYATPSRGIPPGAFAGTGPLRVPPGAACLTAAGAVTRRGIASVRLGDREPRVRALLGPPVHVRAGFAHYCLRGGGRLVVGPRVARLVLTTNAGYGLGAVRRGAAARAFHRRFAGARLLFRQGDTRVWATAPRSSLIVGLRHGRVRFLAVYDRRAARGARALARLLRLAQ